ncbi:putative amidase At4g34880 [Wolffia australiana]
MAVSIFPFRFRQLPIILLQLLLLWNQLPIIILQLLLLWNVSHGRLHEFKIEEATIESILRDFNNGDLSPRKLSKIYVRRINKLNPSLRAVLELNPAALTDASRVQKLNRASRPLYGIPILLKDNIGTAAPLNTTAGSAALLGAASAGDAGVVARLRDAGEVILGKASMSEWASFHSFSAPDGWCARGGQGMNPYNPAATPCGSSSGSAIAVAANLAAVALGTETDGSILCPAAAQSLVGIKPTVGLTSRAGVIPISPRQDTVGPIARTVEDAVRVLEVIAGYDAGDSEMTATAEKFIPRGGYRKFLRRRGLKGKRLGVLRRPFFDFPDGSDIVRAAFQSHLQTLRDEGARIVDNLEIPNLSVILDSYQSGEGMLILAEFKLSLNAYLAALPSSPVRSLADVIVFNDANPLEEKTEEYDQDVLKLTQETTGIGSSELQALKRLASLSAQGLEKLMKEERLDAVVAPETSATGSGVASMVPVLGIGGYPGIVVPAGFDGQGVPFGICFGGLKGSEPALIEIAHGFEQATEIRIPPPRV